MSTHLSSYVKRRDGDGAVLRMALRPAHQVIRELAPLHEPVFDSLHVVIISSPSVEDKELNRNLHSLGCWPITTPSVTDAIREIDRKPVGLVFCEFDVRGGGYVAAMRALEVSKFKFPVVVTTEGFDRQIFRAVLQQGAFDCVSRPYRMSRIEWIVAAALSAARIRAN